MVSSFVLYLMIWWIVLFTVLPFGIEREDQRVKGCDMGAPKKHRLGLKLAATTLIALMLWLGLSYLIHQHFNTYL